MKEAKKRRLKTRKKWRRRRGGRELEVSSVKERAVRGIEK
jgi:hypothetical protein